MAGGVGSRFWPISTPEYPKQFIDILGCGRTLIQLTVERFKDLAPMSNFWVVTNVAYVDIVKQQLPDISVEHILAEPTARNTAPCIAWACWRIKRESPTANVVVTPADAVVLDTKEFHRIINNALNFTSTCESIVTIGIKPSRPETGYGYIETSERVQGEICKVTAFKEKPNLNTARCYQEAGNYLWNAGIFVWNLKTITRCILRYKPNIATDMEKIMETGDVEKIFPNCEKISIDYAIMEPAASDGLVYTHPADFGWSDLGNWASLYDKLQKDADDNAAVGNIKLYECSNCVIHMEDAKKIILQGLDGYIVSEKNGNFLICRRSEEQRIREFSSN